ncbi:MAG: 3-dehydroquinate synthase [Nocardiopsaceae bacterium]|nr:3-dehydroquinate synthase [Nocardiopsaceae bacterium]
MSVTRIPVGGEHPYEVVVGTGVLAELPSLVGKTGSSAGAGWPGGTGSSAGAGWPGGNTETVAVIHAAGLAPIARRAGDALAAAGFNVCVTDIPDGEAAKTLDVAARLWSWLASKRITRSDRVVGIGGGAATDLVGFVAASWLRGVSAVLVPTTVLGMVDAAVGGKTAIDIPEGKNLVGAFFPPAGVLCDLATLQTLPRPDYVAGLAEVIKGGFIADQAILDLVRADPAGAASPSGRHARELIERKIRVKARVVSADLRESGLREILNYGHTLAHAIERVEQYRFRHGDAVAIGTVFAAEVARLSGRLTEADVEAHREILTSVGLPVRYRPPEAWPELREAMSLDKKSRGARLRMVVLEGMANPVIFDNPPEDLLERAYRAVAS